MVDQAVIAAGILEAEGLSPDATVKESTATFAELAAGPSLWSRTREAQTVDEYRQRVNGRLARWRAPRTEFGLASRIDVPEILTPGLRLEVSNLRDWSLLHGDARPTFLLSSYVRREAHAEWTWRWPLRLAVLRSATSTRNVDLARGSGGYNELYKVEETTDPDIACEMLFIEPDEAGRSFPNAAVVAVLGAEVPELSTPALDEFMRLGNAGVVLYSQTSLDWVEPLVVELSHDSPLDVALANAAPGAFLAADPRFIAHATVRQQVIAVAEQMRSVGQEDRATAVEHVILGRFASELGEATETVRFSEMARRDGFDIAIHGGPRKSMAKPPSRGGPPATAKPIEAHGAGGDVAPPDPRHLQTQLRWRRDAVAAPVVTKRFRPGHEHDLRVRIAAKRQKGIVSADLPFPLVSSEALALEVSIVVGITRTRRELTLPPAADSGWTERVHFVVPDDAPSSFSVLIEVAWQGRVIQSGRLGGTPHTLTVDVSEPTTSGLTTRESASALTLIDDAVGGASIVPGSVPVTIDLDRDAGDVGAQQIAEATRNLRQELLNAFLNPPTSLDDAAGPLTRLAVRGRILYDRLAAGSDGYYDGNTWLHVNSFAKSDVPIELIYTHPMPTSDELVPVCPEASARAMDCADNCVHRRDGGVVCPFGFWATSKVIERRRHVPGRSSTLAASTRRVAPTRASAVGISRKADEVDSTASQRIVQALKNAVPQTNVATSWQNLEASAITHPSLLVLVTHTVEAEDGGDLGTKLELNGDLRAIHRIGESAINPGRQQPGPAVLALGCDTRMLTAGYTDLVVNLHNARAEIVLSAISPIPGKNVADFIERFLPALKDVLDGSGPHRFGQAMLEARRATILKGDLLALALTATGDADVELIP